MKSLLSIFAGIYGVLLSTLSFGHSNHGQPLEGSTATQIFHFLTSPNHLLFTTLCFIVIAGIIVIQKRRANKVNRGVLQTRGKQIF